MTNKYAGTQTEKNLQEAFAGESQARNKYTYFASVTPRPTWLQQQKVKTTNGLICTKALPKLQKRKASRNWLLSSEPLARLKNTTKKDTAHCSTTLKQRRYSKRARSRFGNAEIAVIS